MRRRLAVWVALYVIVATAVTVTSSVLEARRKFPVGLTRTVLERTPPSVVARSKTVSTDLDVTFLQDDPTLPQRFITVRWDGVWYRSESKWIDLYAGADDYVRVELDGSVVLERSSPRGTGERRARFLLPQGSHRLAIAYEQDAGDAMLYIGVADAGGVPRAIDPESLFLTNPAPGQVRTNRQLLLLRRAAIASWVVPPVAALAWASIPWLIGFVRGVWRSWRRRNGENLRRLWSPPAVSIAVPRARWWVAGLYAVVVVLFLVSMWRFHDPETGFTTLIVFGEQFQERALPALRQLPHKVYEGSGYDGQFYAQLSLEPLVRNEDLEEALDSVEYRSRRILLSWTAFLFGLGNPPWIIEAYAIQNVGFWLLLGILLLRWLPPVSLRNWLAWCGCLLGVGSIASVRQALTDVPSAALVTLAFVAAETGRTTIAGGVLGLSGLARETNLLGVLGIDWAALWKARRRFHMVAILLLAVLPLIGWLAYLAAVLGPAAWHAGEDNVGVPFAGMAVYVERSVRDIGFSGWASPAFAGLIALAGTLLQAAYLVWRAEWHERWWRVGIVYALLMTGLGFQVWEGNPGASVRALLPMTLAYNVLIARSRWFWPLFVAGNVTIVQGLQAVPLIPW